MASSFELKRRKEEYIDCRNTVIDSIKTLSAPIETCQNMIEGLKVSYLVDDATGDDNVLLNCKGRLESLKSKLNNLSNQFDGLLMNIDSDIKEAEYKEYLKKKEKLKKEKLENKNDEDGIQDGKYND